MDSGAGTGLAPAEEAVRTEEASDTRRSRRHRGQRDTRLFTDAPSTPHGSSSGRRRNGRSGGGVDAGIRPVTRAEWEGEWDATQPALQELESGQLRPSSMPGSSRRRKRGAKEPERLIAAEVPAVLGLDGMQTQRVTQLDGKQLDDEVENLLHLQMKRTFRFFSPGMVQYYQPEMLLVLRLSLFRAAMWPWHTTYGMRLQNLSYRNEHWHEKGILSRLFSKLLPPFLTRPPSLVSEMAAPRKDKFLATPLVDQRHAALSRAQLLAYCVVWIGGRYAVQRLLLHASAQGWSEEDEGSVKLTVWKVLRVIEKISRLVEFLSFVVFLVNGRFLSVVERLLGMRLVHAHRTLPRQVSFEYMNRQLVWQGFTEFLIFALPLLNLSGWKKSLQQLVWGPTRKALPANTCPICTASPIHTQYLTDCNHSYCYHCLATAMMEDATYCCLRCGNKVKAIRRSKSV